ncbi:MAG: hypothetical protein LBU17_01665 [Treponema sp.]|jgi:hypothetical protein|nr:hypothetical protein [Treponema sp.]
MAQKRIKLRIDTAANFALANPTLLNGETAIEIGEDSSRKIKSGNGYTPWLELPYLLDEAKYDAIMQHVEEQDEAQDQRLEIVEQTVGIHTQAITALQEDTVEQGEALAALAEAVQFHTGQLAELEAKDGEQDRILESLTGRIETLEDPRLTDATVVELQAKDAQQDARLDSIDANNQQRDAAIAGVTEKAAAQDNTLQSLGTAVTQCGDRLVSLEAAQGGYTNKFQELQDNDSSQRNRIGALEQGIAGNPAAMGSLQNQITALAEAAQAEAGQRQAKDADHDADLSNLEAALLQEQIARIDANTSLTETLDAVVTELQETLEQETLNRNAAVTELQENLAQEALDRTAADTALEQAILEVNEITEGQAADLETETAARTAADEALHVQITVNRASLQEHAADTDNPHDVTKAQVGLAQVDNTADADKPVSTAQAAAIDNARSEAQEYTDEQIAATVAGTLHYMGDVATYAELPEENELFDLWHILDTGDGYYWFGGTWNHLDFSVDLSAYYQKDETDERLNGKVDKVPGKELSANNFTDEYVQMIQALAGDLKVFHDAITHQSDGYEDILVTRYMLRSDLTVTNSFMEICFDGIRFRARATSASNLRTEVLSEVSGETVIATIRRNSFYNSGVEGQTIQNRELNDTPYVIDSTIYVDSNDYSIYQIFVAGHWWEINLWPANGKSVVLMSLERRL